MIVNKKIKEMFKEISSETIKYMNSKDSERKYIRRLLNIFKTQLNEEEQIFIVKTILEFIHYKNIVTDPDTIITTANIKLRTYFFIFVLTIIGMLTGAILFKTNESLNEIVSLILNVLKVTGL